MKKYWKLFFFTNLSILLLILITAFGVTNVGSVVPGAVPVNNIILGIVILFAGFIPVSLIASLFLFVIYKKASKYNLIWNILVTGLHTIISIPILFLSASIMFETTAFWQAHYRFLSDLGENILFFIK